MEGRKHYVQSRQTIGCKFILFREKDDHAKMIGHPDYGSKVETTFRMGVKGGMHFLGSDENPINIVRMHFDGHRHYHRYVDRDRIVGRLHGLRGYCSIADSDDVIDDRSSDHSRAGCQEYDDCQLLQLADLMVGCFRAEAYRRGRAKEKQCAFWVSCGRHFQSGQGLLVIGRALNGWKATEFEPSKVLADSKRLIRLCRSSFAPEGKCPMRWVTEQWGATDCYNTRRSPFWRMAKRVSERLGFGGPDWCSTICWTNAMRISPATGGNPPGWSEDVQLAGCVRLLELELEALRPSVVLCFTGVSWFHTLAERMGLPIDWRTGSKYVVGVGKTAASQFIVVEHPQGKPEEPMMKEIDACLSDQDGVKA